MKTKLTYENGLPTARCMLLVVLMVSALCLLCQMVYADEPEKHALALAVELETDAEAEISLEPWMQMPVWCRKDINVYCIKALIKQYGLDIGKLYHLCDPDRRIRRYNCLNSALARYNAKQHLVTELSDEPEQELESWMLRPYSIYSDDFVAEAEEEVQLEAWMMDCNCWLAKSLIKRREILSMVDY